MPLLLALALSLAAPVAGLAAGKTAKTETRVAADAANLPYLGPGADKLSAEDYQRVYKNYIQTSILLGYPFFKEKAPPCDQALTAIFRGAGLFGYPVPEDAQHVQRATKTIKGLRVETYELAGLILQVARREKTGGLDRLVLVNSASPKATRRLSGFARNELLELEKDPVTGLERVHKIPVGYPHPYLTQDGQGLYVRVLRFNGKTEGCQPLDFADNAWVGGYDLSEARCTELQTDAEKVWGEQLSPEDFSQRELARMKANAVKSAVANGTKEAEAKALVEKHFGPPLSNEINVVGSAMRNLAQCNLLALGRAGKPAKGQATPSGTGDGTPSDTTKGAGSAQ